MCRIDGCDREPTAKGLCAKHYMRLRRAGDPNRVRKPGWKTSEARNLMREWSPRTFARFTLAMRMLEDAGIGVEEKQRAIKAASRPNGSMNVAKLLRIAETRLAMRTASDQMAGEDALALTRLTSWSLLRRFKAL